MNTHLLRKPVITEKSMQHAKNDNAFTFYVDPSVNKNQIKEVVEATYGVHVVSIRTTKLAGKKRRTGKRRMVTTTEQRKKAIVVLKEGEKIDAFDIQG